MKRLLAVYKIPILTSILVLPLAAAGLVGVSSQIAPGWTSDLTSGMQQATLCQNGNDIILNGNLSHKLHEMWAALLNASADTKQLRLFLNSPGGNNDVAESISNDVKKFGITAVLPANSECFSACPLIFIGSEKRIADPTAKLGFHSPSWRFFFLSGGARDENRVEVAMKKFPVSSKRLADKGAFKSPEIKSQTAEIIQSYDTDFAVIQKIGPIQACNR